MARAAKPASPKADSAPACPVQFRLPASRRGLRRLARLVQTQTAEFQKEEHRLSVHCDGPEWRERAKKTLRNTGARDISSASETAADFGTADKPTERASGVIAHRGETPAPEPIECATPETRQ